MDNRVADICVKILLETDEIESRKQDFNIDEKGWYASRALRDLILMPLVQIGELTTHFKNDEHLELFPSVPWREIKGFRNVVVHGYGQIDLDIAWRSATESVAELRGALLADGEIYERYMAEHKQMTHDENGNLDLEQIIQSLPDMRPGF